MRTAAGVPLVDWLEGLTLGEVVIGLVALGAVLTWVRRKLWPTVRDVVLGLVDLIGAPARNGRDARPGLLATVAQLVEDVASARSEIAEQGDRIARVEGVAAEAASAAAAGQQGVQELGGKVAEISDKVDGLAAEQTQIRQAVEEIRATGHAGTDAASHDTSSTPSAGATAPGDPTD